MTTFNKNTLKACKKNLQTGLPDTIELLVKQYGSYGEKFKRAMKLVDGKCVKLHRFHPSGRNIWTVVGTKGDQLINESQPYCSCRHFHYRVLSDKDDICYHLLGVKMARQVNSYESIDFNDFEYHLFLKFLITDIFKSSIRKE
jgi:predicted nucleic acid-binding Zn finger protein